MSSDGRSGDMSAPPDISVVVPVYGCASCLRVLHERLATTLIEMDLKYEIVLVDDRAGDGSWPLIEQLAAEDQAVCGVLLSRNFGQHAAITAGLARARGNQVVVMDCDLQDPPEDIPRLYAKSLEGYDVVFGRRIAKPTGVARRLVARLYFWAMRRFAGATINGQYGTFSIISRKVVDAFLEFRDEDRHYLMILNWLGFETAAVEYQPALRYAGRSSYSLPRLIEHALDGLFFQTTALLRWVVYLGFVLAMTATGFGAYLVVSRIVGAAYPGWTSIVVLTLGIGGFIIISTGITGLYIGKVFDQSRGRPLYVVDRVASGSGASADVDDRELDLSSRRH